MKRRFVDFAVLAVDFCVSMALVNGKDIACERICDEVTQKSKELAKRR